VYDIVVIFFSWI